MEVKFTIEPTTKLVGGLNFQLVYAKRREVQSWSALTDNDFQDSISINDKAFNLVFGIFITIKTQNALMIYAGCMRMV